MRKKIIAWLFRNGIRQIFFDEIVEMKFKTLSYPPRPQIMEFRFDWTEIKADFVINPNRLQHFETFESEYRNLKRTCVLDMMKEVEKYVSIKEMEYEGSVRTEMRIFVGKLKY